MDCLPHLHLAAYHAEARYNSSTTGIGLICPWEQNLSWGIGTYYNSVRRQSTYAGLAWQPWGLGPVKVGAFGGVVTGYRDAVMPMVAGVASVSLGASAWHLAYLPAVPGHSPDALEMSVTWKY